jgi:nucleotide-binding universal stress UspA family protein
MIQRILVCIEGSPSGERAVELGVDLARQLSAEIGGLAIIDEPDIRSGAASGIGGSSYKRQRDEALMEDAHRQVERWLASFSERCRAAGVRGSPLEETGRPAVTILDEMEKHDLVLMGRDANFRFETAASDARTRDAILHRARKPVLVVPEGPAVESPRVMAAFDGSSASKRALRSFAESGLEHGSEVHVASVDDDGATAWEIASRGVAILTEHGLKAEPQNLVSVLPIADALLKERERLGARMIVMGAYAHSRFSELVWGSVTRELVEKTPVPLYLHH